MIPVKMKRHLKTHTEYGKPIAYFQHLLRQKQKEQEAAKIFTKEHTDEEKLTLASYKIAHLIAQKRKSHTLGEDIIKPAIELVTEALFGKEARDRVSKIPLTAKTIKARLFDIDDDEVNQLIEDLHDTEFSIQLDESTDVSGHAQLMIFVKYLKNGAFVEQLLACRELKTTTRGRDILKVINEVFKDFGLRWENCVQTCTDGAPSMTGHIKGFLALVRLRHPNILFNH